MSENESPDEIESPERFVNPALTSPGDENRPRGRRGFWHPARDEQTRWVKLRRAMFEEDPYCRSCRKVGSLRTAEALDHITPIDLGGAPWARENLQPLCRECHNLKSASEAAARRERANPDAPKTCIHGYHLSGDFACPECVR